MGAAVPWYSRHLKRGEENLLFLAMMTGIRKLPEKVDERQDIGSDELFALADLDANALEYSEREKDRLVVILQVLDGCTHHQLLNHEAG